MDRPLKHLINGIKDATSLRDRDDWEVWASLFPDIATLAEATRRSATTNRGNLPPDRLRAQLLKSNHMPGGGKQELADTVQELLRATRGATATLLALGAAPVLLCPAMDTATYRNPITQRNRRELDNLGYYFLGPQAAESGQARLAEIDKILERVGDMLDPECWGAYI